MMGIKNNEVWRDIKGYEGLYQVSNYGRVKSLPRNGTICQEKILATPASGKYPHVGLRKNGVKTTYTVHKLMMEVFVPNPDNLPCVNHKSECKTENFIWVNPDGSVDPDKSNLEWCTHKYNANYGTRNDRMGDKLKKVEPHKKVLQFDLKNNFIKEYHSTRQAERETGVYHSNITSCCQGKYKAAGTRKGEKFIWRYKDAS